MKREPGSPKRTESPSADASERVEELLRRAAEKEAEALRKRLARDAKAILRGSGEELAPRGEEGLALTFRDAPEMRGRIPAGFDPDALAEDPNFKTEVRAIGTAPHRVEYVVTSRVTRPGGEATLEAYPDAGGRLPDKDDLDAALRHAVFAGERWAEPEEIALVAFSCPRVGARRDKEAWMMRAIQSLRASRPYLTADEAGRIAMTVIDGLLKAHADRLERP